MLIAINRYLVNKAPCVTLRQHNGDFENFDFPAAEVAQLINEGFAFCAQHHSGWRTSKNFSGSGFLAVDVDHWLKLETVLQDTYFLKFGSFLYTTPSHAEDAHRFRVVFELESPIFNPDEFKLALTGLIKRFGADLSCKDPCRIFFGSSRSNPTFVGNRLPVTEVQALQIRAQESSVRFESESGGKGYSSAVRSRLTVASDTMVRTDHGDIALLRDLPARTSIFCPQHFDNRPSAFTLRNRNGVPGLSCSACNATFFLDDGSGVKHSTYKFDYQWDDVLALSYEQFSTHMDQDGNIDLSTILGGRVRQWSDVRYLPYEEPPRKFTPQYGSLGLSDREELAISLLGYDFTSRADITLIKSPKGSGKTEWLKQLVTDAKDSELSVLLIGHRRALISSTADRIGLQGYLAAPKDDDESLDTPPGSAYRVPNRYYAVCVDSLDRLNTQTDHYDLVVIDEVEQVIAHLLSATLREHRREALMRFQYYLKQAGALYCLDADLNKVTVEVLDAMLNDQRDRSFQVLLNWWKPDNRTVHLFDGAKPDGLIGELFNSLSRDERSFVCSNSKELIDRLEGEVVARFGDKVNVLKITSENSQKPEIQTIVRDIKTRALDYNAIFTSPALGTGIDITFDNDAALIDNVFGFFQARINTHFDIDQQLSRVRNPKRINVWISPQEFQFETDQEAIKAELLASGAKHRQLLSFESDGTPVYDDLYDTVYAAVTASQRASKNRLRHHFVNLRKSNGWQVETVAPGEDGIQLGKEIGRAGKDARRLSKFSQILLAPRITSAAFDALKTTESAEKLKDADRPAMRRYEIESFYRCEVTNQMLEADDEGRLRTAVKNFEILLADDETLRVKDGWDTKALTPDQGQLLLKMSWSNEFAHTDRCKSPE